MYLHTTQPNNNQHKGLINLYTYENLVLFGGGKQTIAINFKLNEAEQTFT